MGPDKSKETKSVKEVLKDYVKTTSIKGVPKISKSRSMVMKALWLMAVLCGGSMASFQLTKLTMRYFSYPTMVTIDQVFAHAEFPDVTVCNKYPMSKAIHSQFTPDMYYRKINQLFLEELVVNPHQFFIRNLSRLNITEMDLDEIQSAVFSVSGYFQTIPKQDKFFKKMAKHFIRDCSFYSWDMSLLDIKCDATTVKSFYFPEYFMCFTIHVPEEMRKNIQGVSMVTYLDRSAHATFATYNLHMSHTMTHGVRVLVHPKNTLPFPLEGSTAAPGHDTTITLSPLSIEHLGEPYGRCTTKQYLEYPDDVDKREKSGRGDLTLYKYTSGSCMSTCKQEFIMKTCNCIDISQSYTDRQFFDDSFKGMSLCGNTTAITQTGIELKWMFSIESLIATTEKMLCAIRARSQYEYSNCHCLEPCTQTVYHTSVTQAPWPLKDQQLRFVHEYIIGSDIMEDYQEYVHLLLDYLHTWKDADSIHNNLRNLNTIEENFAQVNVKFGSELVEVISEHPVMRWDLILATIGGALNLWIGISFMTLIELTELGFNVCTLYRGGEKAGNGGRSPNQTRVKNIRVGPASEQTRYGRS